jgi:hypothetical protein
MRRAADLHRVGAASRDLWEHRGGLIDGLQQAQLRVDAQEAAQADLFGRLLQDGLDEARRLGVDLGWGVQEAVTDAAAALHLSDRVVSRLMELGYRLRTDLPATLQAWREGRLTRRHVEAIAQESLGLAGLALVDFESALLLAAEAGATPAQLRHRGRRLRDMADPAAMAGRHETALAERRVAVEAAPGGMAWFNVLLSAEDAHACSDRVRQIALQVRDAEEERGRRRTVSQLQADVVRDLLVGGVVPVRADVPGRLPLGTGVRARVVVTVPVDALLGDDAVPAELAGHGPIDARTARGLAARAAGMERLLIDPDTGVAVGLGRRLYRPTAQLRRFIRTRDGTCRFPGCTRAAHRCEIDHTVNWEWGGRTDPTNVVLR